MAIKVLVVDDRVQSAQALAATNALHGCDVTVVASWAEATDTLSYQLLARTAPPALLLGPLAKDAIDALGVLRGQGIDPPTVLYTENRSQDQDQALTSQYRLRAILHKPFTSEDRNRLLGGAGAPARHIASPLPSLEETVPLPEVSASPPLRSRMPTPPLGSAPPVDFDDLTGSTRSSSVRSEMPVKRAAPASEVDLPTGVQKLLLDPSGAGAAPAPSGKPLAEPPLRGSAPPTRGQAPAAPDADSRMRLSEPRSITVLIIDDRFGTASLLVERVGGSGQRCHVAPSYQEALPILERFMASNMGCELVVGPLSADGVAAVRDYRKRNWGNHVVFYTESATQSQDARLPLQYGCMTILRRAGMSEPLESLISELRYHNRQHPALPQEHVRGQAARGSSPTTTSGLHAPPSVAPTQPSHAAESPKASDSRVVPPTGSVPQRIRRSVLPPAATAAPAVTPPARGDSALNIDVPRAQRQSSRVVVCSSCRQEFVVAASGNLPVRCSHCQTLNHLP